MKLHLQKLILILGSFALLSLGACAKSSNSGGTTTGNPMSSLPLQISIDAQ